MKKQLSTLLTLIMISFFATPSICIETQEDEANSVIHIKADGQVEPPNAPIQRVGNLYTLTGNIISNSSGIAIEKSNITLNGANHTIQGKNSPESRGICLYSVTNVTIKNLTITNFHYGLVFLNSSHNQVIENTIHSNSYGVWLNSSSHNKFYHNNFLNNSYQASLQNSTNTWDSGYPSGGNYWSEYTSIDLHSGFYQNQTGSDGIGDTPHFIDANNTDKYPLMKIWRGPIRNLFSGESYCSIQQAIDSAKTNEAILALNGIYRENIVIYKNMELNGENPNETVIDGKFDDVTLTINTSGVKIRGFTVKNGSPANILIVNSSNCIVADNKLATSFQGIALNNTKNNTIAKNEILQTYIGVVLFNSSKNNITENTIKFCSDSAIQLTDSNGNHINKNVVEKNFDGIKLLNSSKNILAHNLIRSNGNSGVKIQYTSEDNLVNLNTIENNIGHGITIYSSSYNKFYDNNITSNTKIGILLYMRSKYNEIFKNRIKYNGEGVGIKVFSTNNNISMNILVNNKKGIILDYAQSNNIEENQVTKTAYYGMYLYFSNSNHIKANRIENSSTGIFLYMSSYNSLNTNTLKNNTYNLGIDGKNITHFMNYIDNSNTIEEKPVSYLINKENIQVPLNAGYIGLINCTNVIVKNQKLSHNEEGILIAYTKNATIASNNITNNRVGIYLRSSQQILVYHNNFIDNIIQGRTSDSETVYDNGYPSGGNYWSNYAGVDSYSGPYQNKTGSDGIGDAAYAIDTNNIDRYPLTGPITVFDAGVWNGTAYNVDVVSNSTVSGFHFNPDEGAFLKFNVSGEDGTAGFCRVTIPKSLLWVDGGWTITVGNQTITDYNLQEDGNHTYIYFSYQHSTQTVTIQGTHVIPETPTALIPPLFMILSAIALVLAKKKRLKKTKTSNHNYLIPCTYAGEKLNKHV